MSLIFLGQRPEGIEAQLGDDDPKQKIYIQIVTHDGDIYLQTAQDWPEDILAAKLTISQAKEIVEGLEAALRRVGGDSA